MSEPSSRRRATVNGLLCCVILLLLCSSVPPAQSSRADFEGVLLWRRLAIPRARLTEWAPHLGAEPDKVFDIPSDQLVSLQAAWVEVEEASVLIRDGKVRLDAAFPGERAGYLVVDLEGESGFLVLPDRGKVVEVNDREARALRNRLADAEELAGKKLPDFGAKEQARLKKIFKGLTGTKKRDLQPLGKSRRIHGSEARGYELRTEDTVVRGWVTREPRDVVRQFRKAQETRKRLEPFVGKAKDAVATFSEHGLPVLLQTLGPDRYEVDELLRIERRSVPASSFDVPAGLEHTSLEQVMKSTLQAAKSVTPSAAAPTAP